MTSAAAAVNVTILGTDCTDLDGIFINEITRGGPGMLPEVIGEDETVPGAEGVFVLNRVKINRTIEFRGWVRGVSTTEASDRDDYWANRVALEVLMDRTTTGTLTIDTGGVSKSITVRPDSVTFDEQLPSFAYVALVFVSTEPDWS